MGLLIVIDGVDGCGKATQVKNLKDALIDFFNLEEGKTLAVVDFPRYTKPSCKMVEEYLHGSLVEHPDDMDLYTASLFYSIDRSLSYKTEEWGKVYDNGGIVLADRYTSANIIHQGVKIFENSEAYNKSENLSKFIEFYNFIENLEYKLMGIPKPDLNIYLTTNKECNRYMLNGRNREKDIHEKDTNYIDRCIDMIDFLKKYNKIYNATPEVNQFVNVNDVGRWIDKPRATFNIYIDIYKIVKKYIDRWMTE